MYNGLLFVHEVEKILPFVMTWMDLEGILPHEVSQTEKDEYCMASLIIGI